jgi:hypothetical protein
MQISYRVTEPGNTEPGSGKVELGLGCEVGLWEEVKLTSVERFKEESIMEKDKVGEGWVTYR